MTASLAPGLLTARDTQILQLLHSGTPMRRIVEIGAYRRSWTTTDVAVVVARHFTVAAPAPANVIPIQMKRREARCGTPSGYRRHLRLGEPTCPDCRAAHAREEQARYRARTSGPLVVPAATDSGWGPPSPDTPPATVSLTPAQHAVLAALCCGLNNRAIAAKIGSSQDTVKSHLKAVQRALGATDRLHAVVLVLTGQVRVASRTATPVHQRGESANDALGIPVDQQEGVSEAAERGNAPRPLTEPPYVRGGRL